MPDRVMLEGFHAVKHALRFGAEVERVVAVDRDAVLRMARELAADLVGDLERRVEAVSRAEVEALAGRVPYTGAVGVARRPAGPVELRAGAPVVLLEDPRDGANLGACVRVAAAAGAGGVVVTGERDPWGVDALRGSAGLHFALPVAREQDVALNGRPLVALDPAGEAFDVACLADGAVLAFGTERRGLSDGLKARADAALALPMAPGVSSLNLATAVSAVLYAWRLRR